LFELLPLSFIINYFFWYHDKNRGRYYENSKFCEEMGVKWNLMLEPVRTPVDAAFRKEFSLKICSVGSVSKPLYIEQATSGAVITMNFFLNCSKERKRAFTKKVKKTSVH
jgi:hypothetical protein